MSPCCRFRPALVRGIPVTGVSSHRAAAGCPSHVSAARFRKSVTNRENYRLICQGIAILRKKTQCKVWAKSGKLAGKKVEGQTRASILVIADRAMPSQFLASQVPAPPEEAFCVLGRLFYSHLLSSARQFGAHQTSDDRIFRQGLSFLLNFCNGTVRYYRHTRDNTNRLVRAELCICARSAAVRNVVQLSRTWAPAG